MSRICLALVIFSISSAFLWPQNEPLAQAADNESRVIGLNEALGYALTKGMDNQIIEATLAAARAQDELAKAKNGLILSSSASAGLGYGFDEPANGGASKSLLQSGNGSGLTPGVSAGMSVALGQTQISVSASQNILPGVTPTGPTTIGLTLNQTLWDGYPGGLLKAAVDKSALTIQGKTLTADSSRLTLIYNVKKAYFALLGFQRALILKQGIQTKQAEVLKQIQAVYDLRQASALDLKDAQLNALSATVDTRAAQHDLDLARLRFSILLGLEPTEAFSVAETGDPQVPVQSLEEAIKTGLSQRQDVKQLELSLQSSRIDLALAKAGGEPTLNLIASAGYSTDWTLPALKSGQSVAAGLKIGLPILDSGALRDQVDSINAQITAYELQIANSQKNIAADIRDAYESLLLQTQKLEVARLTAERYDMKYTILKLQLEHGTATNQDMLSASLDAASYASAFVTAKSNTELSILQLLNAMGY